MTGDEIEAAIREVTRSMGPCDLNSRKAWDVLVPAVKRLCDAARVEALEQAASLCHIEEAELLVERRRLLNYGNRVQFSDADAERSRELWNQSLGWGHAEVAIRAMAAIKDPATARMCVCGRPSTLASGWCGVDDHLSGTPEERWTRPSGKDS